MNPRRSGFSGFNPCFNGSVERGRAGIASDGGGHVVSILVLMEVLREASGKIPPGSIAPFQSLF